MTTLQQDGTQQYRILLVEDNPGDVRLVRDMFRELGSGRYEMVEANRLEQALVQLARQSFDLALLDLSLPDATGLDGLRQLQELAQELPIVVLAWAGTATRKR